MSGDGKIADEPLLVELPIRIKTYDIDFVGHVNNIVYIRWLEDLRLHLLDTWLPLEGLRAARIVPVIVNTAIHYKKGIVLGERSVLGRMWIPEFGRAVFHLEAQFCVDGEVRASARQRGVFIDADKMRPVRVPLDLVRQHAESKAAE